jgi:hypothetical protein
MGDRPGIAPRPAWRIGRRTRRPAGGAVRRLGETAWSETSDEQQIRWREAVRQNLETLRIRLDSALAGDGLEQPSPILTRIGRGGKIPHWFEELNTRSEPFISACERLFGNKLDCVVLQPEAFDRQRDAIDADFSRIDRGRDEKGAPPIPDADVEALRKIVVAGNSRRQALTNQLENRVTEFLEDASRNPNGSTWKRRLRSSLDGPIGMSFALPWRYHFGRLFARPDAVPATAPTTLDERGARTGAPATDQSRKFSYFSG